MIKLRDIADDDPVLDHSRLLKAMENAFEYAAVHGGIGLTQTKAFNRKFAHWMADHSPWPRYHTDELMRLNKVLNEWDVPHAMVVHDLMVVAKFGRHTKGKFQISKSARDLSSKRGKFFAKIAETYPFEYNHARNARSEFTAPGNWDIFLNIINVESEQGLTETHLVKTFYGLENRDHVIDREYYDHAGFLFTHVLQPLSWIGFLEETSDGGRLSDRTYWKTPLWRACLQLPHRHRPAPAASSLRDFPTRATVDPSRKIAPWPASENLHLLTPSPHDLRTTGPRTGAVRCVALELVKRGTKLTLPQAQRERVMQGFRSPGGLQRFVSMQSATRNRFSVPARRRSALTIRYHRLEAFEAWKSAAHVA